MSSEEKRRPKRSFLRASSPTRRAKAESVNPGTDATAISIRLTQDEKRQLLERAGRMPLATFLRDTLLAADVQAKRTRWNNPVKDHKALARVLAALGQSRLSSNLNQLAKAVNIGVLPVTPDTEAEISEACVAVTAMRRDLMRALGLMEGGQP